MAGMKVSPGFEDPSARPDTKLAARLLVVLTGLVTVAAIDEGVLQLTDFATPDPVKYFYGKRRLGVMMRDDYGRLIETTRHQVGELRTGGDGFGGRGLAVVPQKVAPASSSP